MVTHSTTELIERKRDGGELTADELQWLIAEYTADEVPDYQMAALLMAVFFRGMTTQELSVWTDAMLHSGEVLDFSHIAAPKVDKHSTGGVGDKVSIPLAPIVAACGVAVPMMSGRGLGHTGGTLDKLESIPGFRTALDPDEFRRVLEAHGMVMAGQSETLVPADRRLYALRDATGTVPAIPLISSSIMSKKLAEGLDALVLDVKVGRGAFMKDHGSARTLAETMVQIGAAHRTPVTALLTDMSRPLGRAVGNANEVAESLDTLAGQGPADLTELVERLAVEMLTAGGVADDTGEALDRVRQAVTSGRAAQQLADVIEAQGGDPRVIEDRSLLPAGSLHRIVTADRSGTVVACDALAVGVAAVRLGAGRRRKEDDVDHGVGITVERTVGDEVVAGDVLGVVTGNDTERTQAALEVLARAWEIGDEPVQPPPLVIEKVG